MLALTSPNSTPISHRITLTKPHYLILNLIPTKSRETSKLALTSNPPRAIIIKFSSKLLWQYLPHMHPLFQMLINININICVHQQPPAMATLLPQMHHHTVAHKLCSLRFFLPCGTLTHRVVVAAAWAHGPAPPHGGIVQGGVRIGGVACGRWRRRHRRNSVYRRSKARQRSRADNWIVFVCSAPDARSPGEPALSYRASGCNCFITGFPVVNSVRLET